ncbi:Remorin [Macleaya cordata]|uniref:Remorin n=1 Tax=Macleaya cordata TaxID=56857 RepID=A0A200Q6K8_MACCD|nr:Remorin [Macleaya cordata]
MLNDQRAITNGSSDDYDDDNQIRDIHALTPPHPPPQGNHQSRRREAANWETSSHRSSSLSEGTPSENFSTMSREFNALVIAGSTIGNNGSENEHGGNNNLSRIGEDEHEIPEETNPLAIVPDSNPNFDPVPSPTRRTTLATGSSSSSNNNNNNNNLSRLVEDVTMNRVKREETESKISAWQNAKISKINNRFKREDAIINGWEDEQIQKSTSWMKKVERKLEEKRAKALEKMQNEVAKAHRKAEERRASAEAKRGTKVARVLEIANLMRALGRPPAKRSFFK